jgi:glycosyltransferase involved in cell wall biosynthesis
MTSQTITIDVRWMSSGAGTYAFNLLKRIKACDPSLQVHALTANAERNRVSPYCDRLSVVDTRIYSLHEQIAVASVVTDRSALHATHYNASLLHRGPLLVTIPDVTPLLRPQYCATWKSRLYARPMLRAIAHRADHVFTVSQYSRDQLLRHLHISPEKITVAYNGVGAEFSPFDRIEARAKVRAELGIESPFLVYVGNFRPHKNVDGLLHAFHLLRRRYRDHRLLLIGNDGTLLVSLQKLAARLRLTDTVRFEQNVPQRLLIACYSAADVLVLPSFEEGFGLPLIEAMACGTPVACSNVSSLPEIGGDAATYFNPTNTDEMADVIGNVLEQDELREALRKRGFARAATFSWERSAQTHVDTYRRFLN